MIKFKVKKFYDFSVEELYAVLNLRADVFVVEQKSIYLDLDFKDQQALHILGFVDGILIAYSRIFEKRVYCDLASIGRIVVAKAYRKYGYGLDLLSFSIKSIEIKFKEINIHISAQLYLTDFYKSHGFEIVGEEYLEDGIPHVGMEIIKN
ncbi:GNAT family N-acetyltransferase [Flavicella sp.]|uniref:GNAT family N-acetyltransferase n=1 Tax=Flavicella sp. TaxID=2957742 RepID=UPI003017FB45